MMSNRIIAVLIILQAALVLGFLYLLVSSRAVISLPNGYRIVGVRGNVFIDLPWHQQERVYKETGIIGTRRIGPRVDGYRVFPDIVAGHVSAPKRSEADYGYQPISSEHEIAGYFILNTEMHVTYLGLSRHDWLEKLREFQITEEPRLFRPSVFDKWLGRNRPG